MKASIHGIALLALALGACGGDDDVPAQHADASADAQTDDLDASELDASEADGSLFDGASAMDASSNDAAVPNMRCDRYEAPFDKASDEALFVARFVAIDPELDTRGHYDWTIELRTPSGEAITEAEVEAEGFMPAHGHGTTPITVRHQAGSATYELLDVNLYMAGKWEVRVTARSAAGEDRAVFRACVRDIPDAGELSDAAEPDDDAGP